MVKRILAAFVIGAMGLFIVFQRRELENLRQRNSFLEGEVQKVRNNDEQVQTAKPFRNEEADSSQLRSASLEVQRLKGEIGLLKTEIAAAVHADEIRKAKAAETDEIRKAKAAEEQYNQLKNIYEDLSSLSPDDLRKAIPKRYRDEQLEIYERSLAKAQQQYAQASADFGPNHPESLRLAEAVSNIEQQIDVEMDRVVQRLGLLVEKLKQKLR